MIMAKIRDKSRLSADISPGVATYIGYMF